VTSDRLTDEQVRILATANDWPEDQREEIIVALAREVQESRADAQQNERRVRIGLAVELCAQGSSDERVYMPDGRWTSRPDVLLRTLLAAGKGVTLRQEARREQ
jgi:hypothetical protein